MILNRCGALAPLLIGIGARQALSPTARVQATLPALTGPAPRLTASTSTR